MAEVTFPGVYIEEVPANPKPIPGVDTSAPAMVGLTERGPELPLQIKSFAGFTREFGEAVLPSPATCDKWTLAEEGGQWWHFPLAVKGFFENGGQSLFVKRVPRENLDDLSPNDFVAAIKSLDDVNGVSLCLAPGIWSSAVQDALIKRCETRRDCFAILDPPNGLDLNAICEFRRRFDTSFAALYYPWIEVPDDAGHGVQMAPSAHVAGVYARVDHERRAYTPTHEVVRGIRKLAVNLTTAELDLLNPEGINPLRSFPERGKRNWGARTLSADPQLKYVKVRRLLIFLEQSIDKDTQWTVFEPNDEPLWARVRRSITNFLISVWRTGALRGKKPEEAFLVKCDRSTMTQDDIDQGRLICLVGVAPLKPAEFVIFRIGQWTADRRD